MSRTPLEGLQEIKGSPIDLCRVVDSAPYLLTGMAALAYNAVGPRFSLPLRRRQSTPDILLSFTILREPCESKVHHARRSRAAACPRSDNNNANMTAPKNGISVNVMYGLNVFSPLRLNTDSIVLLLMALLAAAPIEQHHCSIRKPTALS